jgi:hypothetical protein
METHRPIARLLQTRRAPEISRACRVRFNLNSSDSNPSFGRVPGRKPVPTLAQHALTPVRAVYSIRYGALDWDEEVILPDAGF